MIVITNVISACYTQSVNCHFLYDDTLHMVGIVLTDINENCS